MRQTSDVRRDVADQLRILRHITYYREEVVENICDAINIADPVNTFREPEDIYECLADLIDPTCHVVTSTEGTLACDRCHTVMLAVRAKPSFCPNCGARVVSADEAS